MVGSPLTGRFTGPRPVDTGGAPGSRQRNFGPDAPPKHKRKPHKERTERGPKGPIKERPVGRLYDADEDWRAAPEPEDPEIDNIATHKDADEAEEE